MQIVCLHQRVVQLHTDPYTFVLLKLKTAMEKKYSKQSIHHK